MAPRRPTDPAANPCPRTWASLATTADAATRFCSTCNNPVRDLRTLRRKEALGLIAAQRRDARVCLYVRFDAQGRPITRERLGEAHARRAWRSLFGRVAALFLAALSWPGCGRPEPAAPVFDPPQSQTPTPPSAEPDRREVQAEEERLLQNNLEHLRELGYVAMPHDSGD